MMPFPFWHPRTVVVLGCWWGLIAARPITAIEPTVSYMYPAGAQRGTSVTVHVGGHYLHGSAAFDLRGKGLAAGPRVVEVPTRWFEGPLVLKPASQAPEDYPRDHAVKIDVAPDAPLGDSLWRVSTSQGVTAGRPFVIGELPEALEDEMDGRPIPQQVQLPVTVNGRIFPREDVDIWTFAAKAGERITCEVRAARIASPLDACVQVRGPSGERLAENDDHFEKDAWLRFTAPTDGLYQVSIWDAEYRGLQDFVYRLTITAGPYVDHVAPLGGRRGEPVSLQLMGHVPESKIQITLPNDRSGPTWMSLPIQGQSTNPVLLDVGDIPEVRESEADSANEVQLPAHLNGCIRTAGETDTWTFVATKGQVVEYSLAAARWGSSLDGVLTIVEEVSGQPIAQSGSSVANRIEPRGEFAIPADGRYVVRIQDVLVTRGGPDFGYRMRLALRSAPDFSLQLASDALTLVRGKEAKLKVSAERMGGFAGAITLRVPQLPPGVTIENAVIPVSATATEIVLRTDPNTQPKIQTTVVHVEGETILGEQPLVRRATTPLSIQGQANDSLMLAVAMPTPFELDGGELQLRYAARGTVYRRKFKVVRHGFSGPLTLELADRQIRHLQGITGPVLSVPAGVEEIEYPVRVPPWMEMNRTTRAMIMAIGDVTDWDGSVHRVSFASGETRNQIALLTAPCPMNVRAEHPSVVAAAGTTQELPLAVSRGALGAVPITIEIVRPAHMKGVTAEPLVIPADSDQGVLQLHFGDVVGPLNMPLLVRAVAALEGDAVYAETSVELVDANSLTGRSVP